MYVPSFSARMFILCKLQTTKDTESTIGIECNSVSLARGDVSIWDFAGQLEYISTHQFFLSIEVHQNNLSFCAQNWEPNICN
jgi:hypothetical protein